MNYRSVLKLSVALIIVFQGMATVNAQGIAKKAKSAEKRWALAHPFIARGCLNETREALLVIKQYRGKSGLDTALAEGTFDAFRHGYWMASLARKYNPTKVLQLGQAHEESNYQAFLKKEKENGIIPDKPNSDMDLWNNKVGAEIGYRFKNISKDSLAVIILQEISKGSFRTISKNNKKEYLDCAGNVIPIEKTKGIWDNPKCLSPSSLK